MRRAVAAAARPRDNAANRPERPMPTTPPIASQTVPLPDGASLFVRDDTHTAPWDTPKTVLLLHAEGEHSGAWFGWVPRLAGRFRAVRPDQRGCGRSTGNARADLDRLAADAIAVLDAVGSDSAHVVAARYATPIALRLAADHPDRVTSLVLCSGAANPAAALDDRLEQWLATLKSEGVRPWAAAAVGERLDGDSDPATVEGWTTLLAANGPKALIGYLEDLEALDATDDLARITCPTLVVTTDGSTRNPIEATMAWQRRIGSSELQVFTGTGDHVAASHADDVSGAALAFWRKLAKGAAKRERPDQVEREKRRADRVAAKAAQPGKPAKPGRPAP